MGNKIIGIFFLFLVGCTSQQETGTVTKKDGIIAIKVDLESVKDGKLTDYFEPEIEYVLLEDNDISEAQIGEIAKLVAYKDRLFVFDWWIGKSIQIFDRQGNFINRIRSFGEGPEKYIELADIHVVQDTIYVLAQPLKIMKFDLNGRFINEFKIDFLGRTFHYDTGSNLFFIYPGSRADHLVKAVDHSGKTIHHYFTPYSDNYVGNMGDPYNFYGESDGFYFTKTYLDTLYRYESGQFEPKIIFDYRELKMNHREMIEKETQMDRKDFSEYFKNNKGMSFSPFGFSNSKFLMTRVYHNDKAYVSIFDKQNQSFEIINFKLVNDIDESFDFYHPSHNLANGEVAISMRGPALYNQAVAKKQTMSDEEWKAYQKGKGKDFIEAAFYGKETENYVLMILKTKK
ncbi:6-bladed beta-propeller [Rhodonellum sp.]|uniref:6-bladed beta-propeller n=1 Tax=Rhodonellum sp. TaxID=2231180 RepID=UPI002719A054|nr:6-bladed beta-propeller [Rhodonellum sp.]MDO9553875.1 6-bladed beta-propeller [Rhodonellum sp.]